MATPHPIRADLTAEYVRSILDYDPETGVFRWRARPAEMFVSGQRAAKHQASIWNAKHAGRVAGSINHGYIRIRISRRHYGAHRLAWLYEKGEWPAGQIDHENGIHSDNRITNLRTATPTLNQANAKRRRDNSSGFKGVRKDRHRWMARITRNGRECYLGSFDTPEEAHAAYCEAARELHGEFARTG